MIVYPLKSINNLADNFLVKFVFSKKATKFDKIFTVDLTLTTYCQIDGEDFFNFHGLNFTVIKTVLKYMFSNKATKFDEIFTVDLTLTTYCQIDSEDFVKLWSFPHCI